MQVALILAHVNDEGGGKATMEPELLARILKSTPEVRRRRQRRDESPYPARPPPPPSSRAHAASAAQLVPDVRELVRRVAGREPRSDVDPDTIIAQGAAVQAAALSGLIARGEVILLDETPDCQARVR